MIRLEYENTNENARIILYVFVGWEKQKGTGNCVGFLLVFWSCLHDSALSQTHRDYNVGTRMLAAYLVDSKPGLRLCLGSCFMRQRCWNLQTADLPTQGSLSLGSMRVNLTAVISGYKINL